MTKGQTRIEFIFGIIVFSILVFYVVSQINASFSTQIAEYETYTLNAKATNAVKYLAETELASRPYNLSTAKLNALRTNCGAVDSLDLGSYHLSIYNTSGVEVECGIGSLKAPKSSVSKYVIVRNAIGNMTLEIW